MHNVMEENANATLKERLQKSLTLNRNLKNNLYFVSQVSMHVCLFLFYFYFFYFIFFFTNHS